MRKFILLSTFFAGLPTVLVISLVLFMISSYKEDPAHIASLIVHPSTVSYAALPTSQNTFSEEVVATDSCSEMLRQFFEKYKSPLEPYAQIFCDKAEEYNLDHRLLPAIAMQESNLCRIIPDDSFNCWGFGIYGGKVTRFTSYPEAIDTVARGLSKNYIAKGLVTPEEIMVKYTPSSNGSWARGVNHFMEVLQ